MKKMYEIWISVLMAFPRLIGFICGVVAVGYQVGIKRAYFTIKNMGD